MHAGIGAPGAGHGDAVRRRRRTAPSPPRPARSAPGARLQPLPAEETAAVVFDAECVAHRVADLPHQDVAQHARGALRRHRLRPALPRACCARRRGRRCRGRRARARCARVRRAAVFSGTMVSACGACQTGLRGRRRRTRRWVRVCAAAMPRVSDAALDRQDGGSGSADRLRPDRRGKRRSRYRQRDAATEARGAALATAHPTSPPTPRWRRPAAARTPPGESRAAAVRPSIARPASPPGRASRRLGKVALGGGERSILQRDQLLLLRLQLLEFGHARLQLVHFGIARREGFPGLLRVPVAACPPRPRPRCRTCSPRAAPRCGRRDDFQARVRGRAAVLRAGARSAPRRRRRRRGAAIPACCCARTLRAGARQALRPARARIAAAWRLSIAETRPSRARAAPQPRLQPVDVVVDEGIGIGAQQREHRLVDAQRPARAARSRAMCDRACRRCCDGHRSRWPARPSQARAAWRRRRGPARVRRNRAAGRRGAVRAAEPAGRRRASARPPGPATGSAPARSTASDGAGNRRRRPARARRAGAICGGSTSAVYSRTSRPLPQSTSIRKLEQRLGDRLVGGDPDHRLAGGIPADAELQVGGDADRRLQADAREGLRRGEAHLELLEFGRVARDDRDFRDQRLVRAGLHLRAGRGRAPDAGARPRASARASGSLHGSRVSSRMLPCDCGATTRRPAAPRRQCDADRSGALRPRVPRSAPHSARRPCGCCRRRPTGSARADARMSSRMRPT